ncbi:MAG: hypothetical protein HXX09_07850 [Bacteroidetes bacterium]|nr:hypothetical protein [Bacteroidota bacterium]
MNQRLIIQAFLFLLSITFVKAQIKPIELVETTFTVRNSSSETYYFGLAEGDKITFTAGVTGGSSIKEIEFLEYPNSALFGQNNVTLIENKTIEITHSGIYYFKFRQSGFLAGRRSCQLKASRLPANETTVDFNSVVYWESKTDSVFYYEDEKYLKRCDTIVTDVINQPITLKRKGKTDKVAIMFSLPENTQAWSYWIGSGKEANTSFNNGEKQMATNFPFVKKYGLMTGIALNFPVAFVSPMNCIPVSYTFFSGQEEQQSFMNGVINPSMIKKSSCFNFESRADTLKGVQYIGIFNESKKKLDVTIRITAVNINQIWATRSVRKFKLETTSIPYLKAK